MQAQLRKILSYQPDNAHVLDNDAVGIEVTNEGECFERFTEFTLLDKRVERDVNAAAETVRIADELVERFNRKIAGFGAGGKARESGIDGFGAIRQRGPCGFGRSGGGQEFWKLFAQVEGSYPVADRSSSFQTLEAHKPDMTALPKRVMPFPFQDFYSVIRGLRDRNQRWIRCWSR